MGTAIQKLKDGLLSLFLKSNCPLCDRPTEIEFCQYCQRKLLHCELENCSNLWYGNLPVFVWGNYGGTLKQAIATLKYNNQPQLSRPLGHLLGEAWLKSPGATRWKKLTVVPIPLNAKKQQERGFNQAELIGQSFCEYTGYKQQPQALERIRNTEPQHNKNLQERQQNLKDAFVIGKSFQKNPPTSPVLLVDDIYTSGATVQAATETLRKQGIQVYGVVAIATTRK
ncbi:MAG: ComF family protein [Potamolinea sp.]